MNLLTRFLVSLSLLLFLGYGHLSAHKCKDDNSDFPLKKTAYLSQADLRALYSQVLTIEEAPPANEKAPDEIDAATNENREEEEDENEGDEDELVSFKKLKPGNYFTASFYTDIFAYYSHNNIQQGLSTDKLFFFPSPDRYIVFRTIRI